VDCGEIDFSGGDESDNIAIVVGVISGFGDEVILGWGVGGIIVRDIVLRWWWGCVVVGDGRCRVDICGVYGRGSCSPWGRL
jgi:hypothetical protein